MAFQHFMIAQAIWINGRLPEPLGCRAGATIFSELFLRQKDLVLRKYKNQFPPDISTWVFFACSSGFAAPSKRKRQLAFLHQLLFLIYDPNEQSIRTLDSPWKFCRFLFCSFHPFRLRSVWLCRRSNYLRTKCGFCRWSAPKLRGYQQNAQLFSKPVGMRSETARIRSKAVKDMGMLL